MSTTVFESDDFIVEKFEEAGEDPVYSLFIVQRGITVMFDREDWEKLSEVFSQVNVNELRATLNIT